MNLITQFFSKPIAYNGVDYNPINYIQGVLPPLHAKPEKTLHDVKKISKEGLERLQALAIAAAQKADIAKIEYDPKLYKPQTSESDDHHKIQDRIQTLLDREIVLSKQDIQENLPSAQPLQVTQQKTDWVFQKQFNLTRFSKKITAFTVFNKIISAAGIQESSNTFILNLVQKATELETNKTTWQIFSETDQYKKLSYLQIIRAAFWYYLLNLTTILSDTVSTYLSTFITDASNALTSKDPKNRTYFIKTILENIDEFLVQHAAATKDYAFDKNPSGSLRDYQLKAIRRFYNNSLDCLCKQFVQERVGTQNIRVPILREQQKIFLVGHLFAAFESIVNYFIKSASKSAITPEGLKNIIETGIGATDPETLGFPIALTKYVTKQLEVFEETINKNENGSTDPTTPILGTQNLSTVVKNLHTVLKIAQFKTPIELKQQFQLMEDPSSPRYYYESFIDDKVEKVITDSALRLFHMLNEKAQSQELFAQVLDLACEQFSVKDRTDAGREFEEAQANMNRTAQRVFTKLIKDMSEKSVSTSKSKQSIDSAKLSFLKHKAISSTAGQILTEIFESIEEEIKNPEKVNLNFHAKIASAFQILTIFSERKELLDPDKNIEPQDKQAIYQQFMPVYEDARSIAKTLLELQQHHEYFSQYKKAESCFEALENRLQAIPEAMRENPLHISNQFIQSLEIDFKEIMQALSLQKDDEFLINFKDKWINPVCKIAQEIQTQEQAIQALEALQSSDEKEPSILEQYISSKTNGKNHKLNSKQLAAYIREKLAFLNQDQSEELKPLFTNDLNHAENRDLLKNTIQSMSENHQKNKDAALDKFREIVAAFVKDVQKYKMHYQAQAVGNCFQKGYLTKITACVENLKTQSTAFMQALEKTNFLMSPSISKLRIGGGAALLTLSIPFTGIVPGIVLGALGYKVTPVLAKSVYGSLSEKTVFGKFQEAYKFITESGDLVTHALLTRGMKSLIGSK